MAEPRESRFEKLLWLLAGAMLVTAGHLVSTWAESAGQYDLEHQAVGFRAHTDTRYVPLVRAQFWRRDIFLLFISVRNDGSRPEEDVHIVLSRLDEVGAVLPDQMAIAVTIEGELLQDPEQFVGSDRVEFVIPALPVNGSYTLMVITYADDDSLMPALSIRSKHSVSVRQDANQAWIDAVERLLHGSRLLDDEGEWLRRLEW